MSKDTDKIQKQINGKAVVSFDVFDTLLKREVASPHDVFIYMEKKLCADELTDMQHFAEKRVNAEREAREKHPNTEISLCEIYECLPYDESVKQKIMAFEIQTESDVSTANLPLRQIYDQCVAKKKKIYFISDMYLPKEVIEDLLKKNGYTEGTLYVSSESGLTKRSGKLFQYLREQERLDVREWVHIGDSVRADYIAPKRIGIKSILIDRELHCNPYVDRQTGRRNPTYRQLGHFIDIHLSRYSDPYERIGYAVLGPLLYGFSVWLEEMIPEDETIFFLARDGKMLQRAFDVVSNRESKYIYVSRRSVHVAYLGVAKNIEEASQSRYKTIQKDYTQRELALACGLADDEIHKVFAHYGLEENIPVTNTETEKMVLDAIWPLVQEKGMKQYALLERYLRQNGLSRKCAVVDVGWMGTTQMLLECLGFLIDDEAVRWDGYYIGLHKSESACVTSVIKKNGYLYEENREDFQYRIWNTIRSTISFFEMLFLSAEGTTIGYCEEENGRVCPVKKIPDNNENVNNRINVLQDAAIQFVSDIHRSKVKEIIEMNADMAIGNYLAFAEKQTLTSLKLFRDFKYCDGGNEQSFVSEQGSCYYLLHPKRFCHDFNRQYCKAWFLKSVVKVPLPYMSLLGMLRKWTGTDGKE